MATAVVAITGVDTTAAVAAAAEVVAVAAAVEVAAVVAAAVVVVAVAAEGAADPLATTRPYGRHAVLTVAMPC